MLPYLIAGAIGFGIGKLFENGGETFMAGGMTNEDILRSFLTSERETQTNNLATFYSTLGAVMLLRNYGTLIAKRNGRRVEITNVKHSKTTSAITNRLKALAEEMGYNVSYVSEFENGGEADSYDWFWNYDYRHYLRDASPKQRNIVKQKFIKKGLELNGSSPKHAYIVVSTINPSELTSFKKVGSDGIKFAEGGETFMAGGMTNEDIIFEYPKDSNGRVMSWISVGTGNMEIASKTGTVGQVRDGHQLIVLKSETPNKVDYHILVDYLPEENKINIVRGKFNSEPSPKYQSYIDDLFRMLKISQKTRDYQDEDIANQVYVKRYLINNFGNPPKGCEIKATELGVEIHFDSTNKMSSDWAMKIADKYGYPSGNFEMRYSSGNVPITYVDTSKIAKNTSKSEKGYINFGETFMAGGRAGKNYYWITMDRNKIDEYIGYASRMYGMFEGQIYTQAPNKVAFDSQNDMFAFTSMIDNHNNDNDFQEGDEGYIHYEELFNGEPRPNIFDRIIGGKYTGGGEINWNGEDFDYWYSVATEDSNESKKELNKLSKKDSVDYDDVTELALSVRDDINDIGDFYDYDEDEWVDNDAMQMCYAIAEKMLEVAGLKVKYAGGGKITDADLNYYIFPNKIVKIAYLGKIQMGYFFSLKDALKEIEYLTMAYPKNEIEKYAIITPDKTFHLGEKEYNIRFDNGGEADKKYILRRGTPIRKNIRKKRPKTREPKMIRTIFEEEYFEDFDNGGEADDDLFSMSKTIIENGKITEMVIAENVSVNEFNKLFSDKGYEKRNDETLVGFYFMKPNGDTIQLIPSFHKKGEILKYAGGGGVGSKTLTRKYLQNKGRNVFTFGYGMPKDAIDKYGTIGGTEYFELPNGDVYKKSKEDSDKFVLIGNKSKMANGGGVEGMGVDFEKVKKADEIYREHNRERISKGIENFSEESVELWNKKYDDRLNKLNLTYEEKSQLNPKNWYANGGGVDDYIEEQVKQFNTDKYVMRKQYGKENIKDIEYQGFLAIDENNENYERLSDYEFEGEEFDRDNLLEVAKKYPQADYITFHARLMGESDFGIEDELSPIDDLAMEFDMARLNQFANGGEAVMIYLISDNATPKREISISENDILRESKNFFNWRNVSVKRIKSLGSTDYDKFIEFLYKKGYGKEEYAEGGLAKKRRRTQRQR